VSASDLEHQQLRLLRKELGIDTPPDEPGKEVRRRKRKVA